MTEKQFEKLTTEHWVANADGEIGPVLEILTDGHAEVKFLGGDTRYEKFTELTKIKDPTKVKPPIDNLPAERRLCDYCGRKLMPVTRDEYEYIPGQGRSNLYRRMTKRTFQYWRAYGRERGAMFCRWRCALNFAEACYQANMRIKR